MLQIEVEKKIEKNNGFGIERVDSFDDIIIDGHFSSEKQSERRASQDNLNFSL